MQVLGVRPHRHPMHLEPPTDGDHALAVRAGSSDSVHLTVREWCSSSSPRVRYDVQLVLSATLRRVTDAEFRPTPHGIESLEPLPGVRIESAQVHSYF